MTVIERVDPSPAAGDPRLTAHLASYLGVWPPRQPVDVVGSPVRLAPGWDGGTVPAVALASPEGTVVSVPPGCVAAAASALAGVEPITESFGPILAEAVGSPDRASPWVVFRWTATPAGLPDIGRWLPSGDPALPDWLHAFPGEVLVTFDDRGRYIAGVGIKRHTEWGRELAVGTTEEARGKGFARRLVAQAARAELAAGAIPLYVHVADNLPSARVADAAGFPDRGWRLLAVWGRDGGS